MKNMAFCALINKNNSIFLLKKEHSNLLATYLSAFAKSIKKMLFKKPSFLNLLHRAKNLEST